MKKLTVLLAMFVLTSLTATQAATIVLSAESNGVRSCGSAGPRIETFVNGFNLDGTIHGVVKARGQCPCSGRGCHPYVYFKTTARNWSLTGQTISTPVCGLTESCLIDPGFTATDLGGNSIYNALRQTSYGLLYRGILETAPPAFAANVFGEDEF